ncbi:MAG: Zn-ribbon domain-containing OB-fold protein [Actinobacteria bacterium]|nr:Zn-ribbon domain-containing OB-fold protein [Actinomycetota bacterium]
MTDLPGVELTLYPEDLPFFDGLERGEVVVTWCDHCDDHVWPPRSHCIRCYSPVAGSRTLAGTGEIYSYSVVHRGEGVFAKRPPYVLAYVSLDGGPTIMANVVADDPAALAVGARVRLRPRPAPATGRAGALFAVDPSA